MDPTTTIPTDAQCKCRLYPLEFRVPDIDIYRMRSATTDADDTPEFAIYSQDGATQYFEDDIPVSAAGSWQMTNEITTPATMNPGNYWHCLVGDQVGGSTTWAPAKRNSAENDAQPVIQFTQVCTAGEAPATLTSPTLTTVTGQDEWYYKFWDTLP